VKTLGDVVLGQFSQAMTEVEKNLGKMMEEIGRLKRYVVSLEEENIRLKRQMFAVSEREIERVQSNAGRIQLEARENLEKMYQEGFHVCHFYFGEPLEEGCLFCSAFLQHERD